MTGPRRELIAVAASLVERSITGIANASPEQLIRAAAMLSGFSFARGASMSRPFRALGSDEQQQ
jgi:hypothetical protein